MLENMIFRVAKEGCLEVAPLAHFQVLSTSVEVGEQGVVGYVPVETFYPPRGKQALRVRIIHWRNPKPDTKCENVFLSTLSAGCTQIETHNV